MPGRLSSIYFQPLTRYTSATDADRAEMLRAIGVGAIDELFAEIPADLRVDRPLDLPRGLSETECFDHLSQLAEHNADLPRKPKIIVAAKMDAAIPEKVQKLSRWCAKNHLELVKISSVTGEGLDELKRAVLRKLNAGANTERHADISRQSRLPKV